MSERFVARNSPLKLAVLLVLSVAFVVLGLWIAGLFGPPPRPGREWAGWLAILFFALCAFVCARRMFDREDWIVIDSSGILSRQWSETVIPWSAIRSYRHHSIRGQEFICFELNDPSRYPPAGTGAIFGGLNKSMGFGDVTLGAAGTDRRFRELAEAVSRHAPPGVRPR